MASAPWGWHRPPTTQSQLQWPPVAGPLRPPLFVPRVPGTLPSSLRPPSCGSTPTREDARHGSRVRPTAVVDQIWDRTSPKSFAPPRASASATVAKSSSVPSSGSLPSTSWSASVGVHRTQVYVSIAPGYLQLRALGGRVPGRSVPKGIAYP